jgi:hypothetical protein
MMKAPLDLDDTRVRRIDEPKRVMVSPVDDRIMAVANARACGD